MKIVIAGGTGFIGSHLCQQLLEAGHQITVLSRNPMKARQKLPTTVNTVEWSNQGHGPVQQTLNGIDALINLAGEPIADVRWSESRKQVLRTSRLDTTRRLVEAMVDLSHRPKILINASGIGFYGPQDHHPMTEQSTRGQGFLADLCVHWEEEASQAEALGLRVIFFADRNGIRENRWCPF